MTQLRAAHAAVQTCIILDVLALFVDTRSTEAHSMRLSTTVLLTQLPEKGTRSWCLQQQLQLLRSTRICSTAADLQLLEY
jgi:hypothetical protein